MNVLGIDAGGTKTVFSLCNQKGEVLCTLLRPSSALPQIGEEAQRELLREGMLATLAEAGLSPQEPFEDLSAVCFGAPCWGESKIGDEAMRRSMGRICGNVPWLICNDAQVAWAGSFALRPGINIVAGTGAMAFGVDASGEMARCGGWGEHFADEGSGYWLGKRMLSLFCKEADGRLPKAALYPLVREHFYLSDDYDITEAVLNDWLPYRSKVAGLQMLLLEAARRGDGNAIDCYCEAGREIAMNVKGILEKLDFSAGAEVSYSGGIFKVGAWVMDSFRQALRDYGCKLVHPLAPPWVGALMTALQIIGADMPAALAQLIEAGREG